MKYAIWVFGITFSIGMAACDEECWPWLESAAVVAIIGGMFGILTEYLKAHMEHKYGKQEEADG